MPWYLINLYACMRHAEKVLIENLINISNDIFLKYSCKNIVGQDLAVAIYKTQLIENKIAIEVIGDRSRFSNSLIEAMARAGEATAEGTRLKLNILANYGGRWDIAETAKRLAAQVQAGTLELRAINEQLFENNQNLAGQSSVDLLIRTGGEHRISNFLLWQSAYAELVFSAVLWPDFDGEALDACLLEYSGRERRFGKTSEQVKG